MHGGNESHPAEIEIRTPSVVQRVRIPDSLLPVPTDDLEVGDQGRAGAFQDILRIGEVILMAVGQQHVIRLDRVDIDSLRPRVRSDERVEKEAHGACLDEQRGMPEIGDLHAPNLGKDRPPRNTDRRLPTDGSGCATTPRRTPGTNHS